MISIKWPVNSHLTKPEMQNEEYSKVHTELETSSIAYRNLWEVFYRWIRIN